MKIPSLLNLSFVLLSGGLVAGCSSSTSTTPPANSGSVNPPATIEFNSVATGRWHDTTYSVANTFTDSITITGVTFTTPSMASSMVKDTVDVFPIAIAGGKSAVLHVEYLAADAGSQTASDSISFKHAGSAMTTGASIHATGVYAPPGVGSSFTFNFTTVDTNGVTAPSTDSVYHVASTSVSLAGKTGVIVVVGPTGDSMFYHPETNGDVSEYFQSVTIDLSNAGVNTDPIVIPAQWTILPTGTHTAQNLTLYDSTTDGTVQYLGQTVAVQLHLTATSQSTYSGTEAISAASTTFNTQKADNNAVVRLQVIAGGSTQVDQSETHRSTVWYAPNIEFFVKEIQAIQPHGSTKLNTTTQILTKYDLH